MADSPDKNTDGTVGVTVKLNGSPMADDILLQSVRIQNALNRIPEATFTLLAEGLQIEDFTAIDSADVKLGTEVEISAFYGSGSEQTLFKGVILSTRARLDGQRGTRLELTCRDKAMAMTEVRVSAPYEDMKDSDIMSKVIKDAGLTADVTATSEQAPINLRVGATSWDFLRLLADRNGYLLYVNDAKITAAPPDTSASDVLEVSYGIDVFELDITVDSHRMLAEATSTAWSEKDQEVVSGEFKTPTDSTLGNTKAKDIAKVLGSRALLSSTARELTKADLNIYTEARVERAALAAVRGSVKFQGNGKIKPSDMLGIKGFGDRFSGSGFVTSLEHSIENGSWTTLARVGLPQDWTSDSGGLAAPAAEAVSTPVQGLQIGKVVQVHDDPEGRQRLKVTLPMLGDPAPEVWARHATPYASGDIGFQFLPEVGDEVIIAFLNADPNAPIIVGALHNDKAKRPVEAQEQNYVKTIVTRELLKVTMDDEKKIITVETPGGHVLTMDDDATTFSLEDSNGNSIVMDSSGITMTTGADITMTATGNITAEATGDATVNGLNVTCEGQAGFTGKGGATAEVSAGGQTKVEGSIVMIN